MRSGAEHRCELGGSSLAGGKRGGGAGGVFPREGGRRGVGPKGGSNGSGASSPVADSVASEPGVREEDRRRSRGKSGRAKPSP